MRTLMSGNPWYSLKKGSTQSVVEAAEAGELTSFWIARSPHAANGYLRRGL